MSPSPVGPVDLDSYCFVDLFDFSSLKRHIDGLPEAFEGCPRCSSSELRIWTASLGQTNDLKLLAAALESRGTRLLPDKPSNSPYKLLSVPLADISLEENIQTWSAGAASAVVWPTPLVTVEQFVTGQLHSFLSLQYYFRLSSSFKTSLIIVCQE